MSDSRYQGILYGVNQDTRKPAVWQGSYWQDLNWDNWALSDIAFAPDGAIWVVGSEGNVGIYDTGTDTMKNLGLLGGQQLRQLMFDYNGDKYGVTVDNRLLKWPAQGLIWEDFSHGWSIFSVAIDNYGKLWCVGTEHNVGQYNYETNNWDNQGLMGDWSIRELVFDYQNGLLCIGTLSNVGKWMGPKNGWVNLGLLGGQSMFMMTIKSVVEMSGIVYDTDNATFGPQQSIVVDTKTYSNDTGATQQDSFSFSKTTTSTATFTWNQSATINVSVEADVGIPLLEEGKVTIGASATVSIGGSHTNTETQSFTWTDKLNVPPHTEVTEVARLSKGMVTVPYVATLTYRGLQHEENGTFIGTNDFNATITTSEQPYKGKKSVTKMA